VVTADFGLYLETSVSGTVTREVAGTPIAGCLRPFFDPRGAFVTSVGDERRRSLLDASLTPGTYYARTYNSLGYANEAYDDVPCRDCSATSGAPIQVATAASVTGIDFALKRNGTLSGNGDRRCDGAAPVRCDGRCLRRHRTLRGQRHDQRVRDLHDLEPAPPRTTRARRMHPAT